MNRKTPLTNRLVQACRQRIGWEGGLQPFLFKKLPPKTGWAATLGSLSVMLFVTMFISGVFLAMYYNPSPDRAYQSVDYIMEEVPAGWLLRGIHHWGASAMVVAVFLHMLTNFFAGTYKRPRELTWVSGVFLLLIVLGLGFTGYLLPWDMKAFWATTVSANIPRDIPLVGDFIARLMLGGDEVSGATLTRFYAVHAMLLPALLVAVLAFHIYLVRAHGISGEEEMQAEEDAQKLAPESLSGADPAMAASANGDAKAAPVYRFYPEHAWRSSLVFAGMLLVLIGLSIFAHLPREAIAGTLIETYLPRPEWYYMWLFQLLTYFPGKWEAVGSLGIPFLIVTFLLLLPFMDRSRRMGVRNRPLILAVGVTFIVAVAYLTIMGFAGTRPYGHIVPIPDRELTDSETRGLQIYLARECAYCHQIDGQGGLRAGPDLANMVIKNRSREYLAQYIKDPQSINRYATMPAYDLPAEDLNALADFLLALDFRTHNQIVVTAGEALGKGEPPTNR
jgi:quinol-cytochrome oxidoreductase complex cytochrome b subunit